MAAVPTPPTIEVGISDTSELNQFRDSIAFLQRPPIANLRQTAAQTFTTGVQAAIQFNAFDVDSDVDGVGGHDTVTNNTRYTARYAGWYEVSGAVVFVANATGDRFAWLQVNGADVAASVGFLAGDATASAATACRTMLIFLGAGDYVELIGFQSSGVNLNTDGTGRNQSSLTVHWASV